MARWRTLTVNERLATVAARRAEEETKNPGKFVYVYVDDMTDKRGLPRVRVVIRNKRWAESRLA
jgi:hypothetical protein